MPMIDGEFIRPEKAYVVGEFVTRRRISSVKQFSGKIIHTWFVRGHELGGRKYLLRHPETNKVYHCDAWDILREDGYRVGRLRLNAVPPMEEQD